MRNYLIITIIILLFGGCSTSRKISKSSTDVKIEKDLESYNELVVKTNEVKSGKSHVKESSIVEEISIKKVLPIELTANFKIDSNATLRGDTALKLVDVSDKNISVTIYQNGKNGQLTAKIKSKAGAVDLPFSEINIKKSSTTKESSIDTTKTLTKDSTASSSFKDKSKLEVKETVEEKEIDKLNNYGLLMVFVLIIISLLVWRKFFK